MKQDLVLSNLHLRDLNPRICGWEACAPGHTFGPAVREYHLLHYVVRGTGVFRRAQAVYTLRAGDIFVIRPGESTVYVADQADPWEYIWVGFDCAPQFAALLDRDVIRLPSAGRNFAAMAGCSAAAQEWSICGQLYELFSQLAAGAGAGRAPQPDYVGRAINYIESNYSQPVRVEEIARSLGLSRNYFCRLFHQQTGFSPQAYLIEYRLARALQFLENGMTQAQAARQAGYPDVFAFSRMFRRRYGLPPGRYLEARGKPPHS